MRMTALNYSVRSQIKMLVGLLIAITVSFNATAEESKRQPRLDQDISREMPERLDKRSHKRHAARINFPPSRHERAEARSKKRDVDGRDIRQPTSNSEKRNPAVTRFKSNTDTDQTPNAVQIKQEANKPEYQTNQRQRKTQRQHKQNERDRPFASNNKRDHRSQHIKPREHHSNHVRNRDHYRGHIKQRHDRNRANKRWAKRRFAEHRRFYNAHYDSSRHSNRRGKKYWHKKHRAFGRSYYPTTSLIYSDYLRANRHEHEHPSDFVWRQIDTFYTPTGRHGYEGEEIIIDINKRVRSIQLEGRKRRVLIEAAHVEFSNGDVRRIPEFEGMLYNNDEINFHFRHSRYVVAVYLDVASNDGKKGKASLSVLKIRNRH